jgi:NADPH:quinone reductase-like Zn-dependent oxidoreductase
MSAEDATMKAYLVNRYKSPMQAGGAAEPTVGDRDVLVDIHAAGVNQLDAKMRDGEFKFLLAYKAPFTLRHDQAGVVTRVGSAVTRFTVGDQVYGRPRDHRIGTFAERIAVHEDDLAIKPARLFMAEAASVPPRIRPGVYRLGTLAGRRTLSAVARMAAQGLPAAMLDPFSP